MEDAETALYKELATVKEVKKQLIQVKRQLKKLMEKVESLELLGLKEQISSLHDELTNLKELELEGRRFAAKHMVDNFCVDIIAWFARYHLLDDARYMPAREYLLHTSAEALQNIRSSEKTSKVAEDFKAQCYEYCTKHEIDYFVEP